MAVDWTASGTSTFEVVLGIRCGGAGTHWPGGRWQSTDLTAGSSRWPAAPIRAVPCQRARRVGGQWQQLGTHTPTDERTAAVDTCAAFGRRRPTERSLPTQCGWPLTPSVNTTARRRRQTLRNHFACRPAPALQQSVDWQTMARSQLRQTNSHDVDR